MPRGNRALRRPRRPHKPVTVLVDGESAFQGDVKRTLRSALEWVETRRDFSAVPVAKVALSR